MSNVIPFPSKIPVGAHNPTVEANSALDDAIEDLADAMQMYTMAGDYKMAQAMRRHMLGLQALRDRR